MDVLPESARVDLDAGITTGGFTGMLEGLSLILGLEYGDEAPDLREMLCVSGVAFKNYVFEPEFNQFEDPVPEFSKEASFVCNYGPFESLAYYTGYDIKEFNGISRDDFWKLLRFELASGRPVVTMGLKGPLQPALVTGYDESDRSPIATVARARSSESEDVDLTGERYMQGENESFRNWLVIARPGEQSEWTPSANRQRLRVLRWADTHAERPKEFSQETRENYAPGLSGFNSFQNFLERHESADFDATEMVDCVVTHVEELGVGRRAAATRLPRWAEELVADEDISIDDPDAIIDQFSDLAGEYAGVAEPLEEWRSGLADTIDAIDIDADALSDLTAAHERARSRERSAASKLSLLVEDLPNLF